MSSGGLEMSVCRGAASHELGFAALTLSWAHPAALRSCLIPQPVPFQISSAAPGRLGIPTGNYPRGNTLHEWLPGIR